MWYQSSFLASKGRLCCWGFGLVLIDQVNLGFVINLGSVGALQWWFVCWKIMASSSRIEIEKFNGKNIELWKLKMEDLLVDKEQWIIVDHGTWPTGTQPIGTQTIDTQTTSTQTTSTQSTGMSQEDWEKMDRRERSMIRPFLAD